MRSDADRAVLNQDDVGPQDSSDLIVTLVRKQVEVSQHLQYFQDIVTGVVVMAVEEKKDYWFADYAKDK
jgi:hypothetical protein